MSYLARFILVGIALSTLGIPETNAEQGCPPGQFPIGGQGAAACAPIPQGDSVQKQPRPIGKWINTWGAIASDGGDNLGVSVGERGKKSAQDAALLKCKEQSNQECKIEFTYYNQCAAIVEPYRDEKAIPGVMAYAGAPTEEMANTNALSFCKKNNPAAKCRSIYTECTKPIFKKY
ncbi:DUF4189 domain-containing protein [Xanthomonas sp. WHRI 8393]|uniref:DUF4189 domain-containing protein n=1 Tax=Xanthomonas sp. WHRI 8393 TaxID=3161574 RepID=UPI0032E8BD17